MSSLFALSRMYAFVLPDTVLLKQPALKKKKDMKKILLMLLFVAPMALFAQKYAQVDYFALVQAMPSFKTAQTELETLGKSYEADLAELQKEIETKMQKYQAEVNEQTPANIRQRREQEIQEFYQRYEQAREDNSRSFEEAKQAKLQPLYVAVADAVKAYLEGRGCKINSAVGKGVAFGITTGRVAVVTSK